MTIEDGCYSLKMECAMRDFGFIVFKSLVVAKAGEFFVRPIGYSKVIDMRDDLLGFQIGRPEIIIPNFDYQLSYLPIRGSAKRALDVALRGRL